MTFALTRRRILVALIATVILAILGLSLFRPRSADVTVEPPPCKSCGAIYSSAGAIPTIGVCSLLSDSSSYANQLVRLKAVFHHDAGQTYLRAEEGECLHVQAIKTGLDQSSQGCDGARKALNIYSGFETWYDSHAKVVVVGRVGRINNPGSFFHTDQGFNILCLETVEPSGTGEAERRKYESWLSWLIQPHQ